MLKRISYTVKFEKTGKVLKNEISFQKGFGAIVGPNESGKSMVIELVRYALFGSAALRGVVADYMELKVDLYFSVRGQEYWIHRSLKEAGLHQMTYKSNGGSAEPLAVGQKPVNLKIVQLLGFGMDVFDMACVTLQGEIEKLGTMGPADRKRMVDSVIGMGVIEDMIKQSNSEALIAGRDAENIKANLRKPIEPIKPDGYRDDVGLDLLMLRDMKTEYDQLAGATSMLIAIPEEPILRYQSFPVEYMEAEQAKRVELLTEIRLLSRDIKVMKVGPYSQYELQEMIVDWERYEVWSAMHDKLTKVGSALDLQKAHMKECPNCGHKFYGQDSMERLANLEDEYQTLKDEISLMGDQIVKPELTLADIHYELAAINEYIISKVQRDRLDWLNEELEDTVDYSDALLELERYETQKLRYEQDLEDFKKKKAAREIALDRMNELQQHINKLPLIEELAQRCRDYDLLFDLYKNHDVPLYIEGLDRVIKAQVISKDWLAAKEALIELRTSVKQHLVPSLSLWASRLLSNMTGGQRRSIVVDEEFEVTVDGQPLSTLSGSGKAVANLALRIGLGQVLTNGVFSLFVGDEIDAAMDKDRAENTAVTMQSLRKDISQILLVTHKYPEADYYIDLGKTNEQPD